MPWFKKVRCPKCNLEFNASFATPADGNYEKPPKATFCPNCGWVGEGEAPEWAKHQMKPRGCAITNPKGGGEAGVNEKDWGIDPAEHLYYEIRWRKAVMRMMDEMVVQLTKRRRDQ